MSEMINKIKYVIEWENDSFRIFERFDTRLERIMTPFINHTVEEAEKYLQDYIKKKNQRKCFDKDGKEIKVND